MSNQLAGPATLVLSASVARRYYLDGRSKVEIAEEFGLSRFKVARLIEVARASGLVRIEIGHKGLIDVDLSARSAEPVRARARGGRRHPGRRRGVRRKHLGQVAAELLAEVVGPEDVLGVAWSRSVGAMAGALPRLAAVPVVQLTGAISLPDGDESSIDIVRDVARAAGGPAYVFYAPFTRARRGHGAGPAPAAGGRPGLRPAAPGDQGRRRRRALGRRAVDAVRLRQRTATAGAAPARRVRRGLRGVPRRRRRAGADRADRAHDRDRRRADAGDPRGDRDLPTAWPRCPRRARRSAAAWSAAW